MVKILTWLEIEDLLRDVDVVASMEKAFVTYSEGRANVPPVGELVFDEPPGETHIKYGHVAGDAQFVIKIASGFYKNAELNLATNSGLMLVLSARTGHPECILLDEGRLTDIRTAAAGAVAAKHLAPTEVHRIGVFGTGVQARLQVQYLKDITPCREIVVWGRSLGSLEAYRNDMQDNGFNVEIAEQESDVTSRCNLIVTTTPSKAPLIAASAIRPGTHITAVGADTADKRELGAGSMKLADCVVVDSRAQCLERGETAWAIREKDLIPDDMVELGRVIAGQAKVRSNDRQITIADLTGVAVQDIAIANGVLAASRKRAEST